MLRSYSTYTASDHDWFVVPPKLCFVVANWHLCQKGPEIARNTRSPKLIVKCCTTDGCFKHDIKSTCYVRWLAFISLPGLLKTRNQKVGDAEAAKTGFGL